MGGLYCGHSDKFIAMSEELASRIDKDFGNRILAVWHDESQYNRYLLEEHKVRVLTPSYGYVEGCRLPFENKIEILPKDKFFDVNAFKRYAPSVKTKRTFAVKVIVRLKRIYSRLMANIFCLRDSLLMRHM